MEDFPAGVNKEVLFQFHAVLLAVQDYASCSHFNSVPLHNLIPSLLLPSHDCQFPQFAALESESLGSLSINAFSASVEATSHEVLFPSLSFLAMSHWCSLSSGLMFLSYCVCSSTYSLTFVPCRSTFPPIRGT